MGNWHTANLVIAKSTALNAVRIFDVDCMKAVPAKEDSVQCVVAEYSVPGTLYSESF